MKYFLRVALYLLYNKRGQILLQHRDAQAPRQPNQWAFFGGHIRPGESPDQTVRREAEEELGITLHRLIFWKIFRQPSSTGEGRLEKHIFLCPLTASLKQLRAQQTEGDGLALFSSRDLSNITMAKDDRIVLVELFKQSIEQITTVKHSRS